MTAVVKSLEVFLVNTRQAAQILNVSQRTIANLCYRGQLRSVKVGKSRRYATDELLRIKEHGTAEIVAAASTSLNINSK